MKPGITGPWQVYGRSELTFDEVLAVEREYVENLSLGRDLRIILMTHPGRLRPARRVLARPFHRLPERTLAMVAEMGASRGGNA